MVKIKMEQTLETEGNPSYEMSQKQWLAIYINQGLESLHKEPFYSNFNENESRYLELIDPGITHFIHGTVRFI